MEGHEKCNGITPRIINSMFSMLEKEKNYQYRIRCSYIQIYNEKVYDLLSTNSKPNALKMRYTTQLGFYLENLFIFQCSNARELLEKENYGKSCIECKFFTFSLYVYNIL